MLRLPRRRWPARHGPACSHPRQSEDIHDRGVFYSGPRNGDPVLNNSVTDTHRARGNEFVQETTRNNRNDRRLRRVVVLRHFAYTRWLENVKEENAQNNMPRSTREVKCNRRKQLRLEKNLVPLSRSREQGFLDLQGRPRWTKLQGWQCFEIRSSRV